MGIRELKAQKSEARTIYEEECARIDTQIAAIRAGYGYKLKEHTPTAHDVHLLNMADGRTRTLNPHGE